MDSSEKTEGGAPHPGSFGFDESPGIRRTGPAPSTTEALPAISGCFLTQVCTSLSWFLMRENQAVINRQT